MCVSLVIALEVLSWKSINVMMWSCKLSPTGKSATTGIYTNGYKMRKIVEFRKTQANPNFKTWDIMNALVCFKKLHV